jgi:hypothetical protein
MSLFYTLYSFYLNIKLYVKDNVLEGKALVVIERVKRI